MLYLFYCFEEDKDKQGAFKKAVEDGIGVYYDKNHFTLLSRKQNIFGYKHSCTLNDSINDDYGYGSGVRGEIKLGHGAIVSMEDSANILLGELDQPSSDKGKTYEEIIYEAEVPSIKVDELIKEFLDTALTIVLTDIEYSINKIKEEIKNKTFEW